MPLTSPSEIFQQKIAPAYEEYLQSPCSERRANSLATAINDQAEWTLQYYKDNGNSNRLLGATSPREFREQLFGKCPELKMMWDLADASKHRLLSNPAHSVSASTAAYVVQGGDLIVTAPYNQSFSRAAETVVKFWKGWQD
jgi:hypothetical protein